MQYCVDIGDWHWAIMFLHSEQTLRRHRLDTIIPSAQPLVCSAGLSGIYQAFLDCSMDFLWVIAVLKLKDKGPKLKGQELTQIKGNNKAEVNM